MKINCPICKAITTWEENPHRPFCSEKCKLIDLGKWISEEYRIEGKEQITNSKEPRANSKEQSVNN